MAFVNRNERNKDGNKNNNGNNKLKNNTPSNQNVIDNLKIINNLKAENKENKEKQFYLKKSIEAINIIEEKYGFNFYDEERRGGMHLNNKSNLPINNEKNNSDTKVNNSVISGLLSKIKNKNN